MEETHTKFKMAKIRFSYLTLIRNNIITDFQFSIYTGISFQHSYLMVNVIIFNAIVLVLAAKWFHINLLLVAFVKKINAIHMSQFHLAAYKFTSTAGGKYLRRHPFNTKRRFLI